VRISATRPELDLIPVRLPFDATSKRRKENQRRSATALQHNSSLAAEKGKYGALDPSQFVAHLELAELEHATQGEGTMIGIGIVLVAAIASFYVLRIVNEN